MATKIRMKKCNTKFICIDATSCDNDLILYEEYLVNRVFYNHDNEVVAISIVDKGLYHIDRFLTISEYRLKKLKKLTNV